MNAGGSEETMLRLALNKFSDQDLINELAERRKEQVIREGIALHNTINEFIDWINATQEGKNNE